MINNTNIEALAWYLQECKDKDKKKEIVKEIREKSIYLI